MTEEQLEIFRQQQFDSQEFMDDDQLLILIEKYDPTMNSADIEYLMQLDDREAVINTLYAKLMEREHIQLQIIDESTKNDGTIYQKEDDLIEIESEQLEHQQYAIQINKDINKINNRISSANQYEYYQTENQNILVDCQNNNRTSELKNIKNPNSTQCKRKKTKQNEDQQKNSIQKNKSVRKQLGLVHSSNFKMQNNQIIDNNNSSNNKPKNEKQLKKIQKQNKLNSQMQQMNNEDQCNSKISFEEEIYDEEFENQLKDFQQKLQQKEECSLERIYCYQQFLRNGSTGRHPRKLVPNVSNEWINQLKLQLKKIIFNKSIDRNKQNVNKREQNADNCQRSNQQQINDENSSLLNRRIDNYTQENNADINNEKSSNYINYINQNNVNYNQKLDNKKQRSTAPNRQAWRGENSINADVSQLNFNEKNYLNQCIPYNQNIGVTIGAQAHGLCMTNSTAGVSFNSPRATERISGYDEVEHIVEQQKNVNEQNENNNFQKSNINNYIDQQSAAAGLFMGAPEAQLINIYCNEQIIDYENNQNSLEYDKMQLKIKEQRSNKSGIQLMNSQKKEIKKRQNNHHLNVEVQHQSA